MKRKDRIRHLWIALACAVCVVYGMQTMAQAAETDVHLIKAEGTVDVAGPGGRGLVRIANMKLSGGHQVRTGEDSRVWIGMGDQAEVRLEAEGELEVRTAGDRAEILLKAGSLYFDMGESSDTVIRLATAAYSIRNGTGWIQAADPQHSYLYLLEGTARCCVTDPVTGQVEQKTATGGTLADCAVYAEGPEGKRCDILLKDLSEEEAEKCLADDQIRLPALRKAAQAESRNYAALRDPVWEQEEHYASAEPEQTKLPGNTEEEAEDVDSSGDDDTSASPSAPSSAVSEVPPAAQTVSPAAVEAAPESAPEEEKPQHSHSSRPRPKKQPPASAPPEQISGEPTPDQGVIVEGFARNGPEGVIEVRAGGRVRLEDGLTLYNEGDITSQGSIEGIVCNEENAAAGRSGILNLEGGTITGVAQKQGTVRMSGGSVTESCTLSGGELILSGGTVPGVVQTAGAFVMSGGSVDGAYVMNGGSMQLAAGTLDRVLQTSGAVDLTGSSVTGAYTVEDGELRLSGGSVGSVVLKSGTVDMAGGSMTDGFTMEDGTLRLSRGTIAGFTQRAGTVQLFGGTVTGGFTVEGGRFRMSGGTLRADGGEAALRVAASGSVPAGTVTEATADVCITGGTVIGNGTGKAAVQAEQGAVLISREAVIKADEAFNTVTGSKDGSWRIRYEDYLLTPDGIDNEAGNSAVYVSRKESDGLVRLRMLSDDLALAVKAEAGDIITLSGNVTVDTDIQAVGGTQDTPVILELNQKTLRVSGAGNPAFRIGSLEGNVRPSVWQIQGNGGCLESGPSGNGIPVITVEKDSTVLLADVRTQADTEVSNAGSLTISDSSLSSLHNASGIAVIEGDSTIKRLSNDGGKTVMAGGTVTDGCVVSDGRFEMTGGTLLAGAADAALTVRTVLPQGPLPEDLFTLSDYEGIYLTGGTLIGDGEGKRAIEIQSGVAAINNQNNQVAVKANLALDTIAARSGVGANWALQYIDDEGQKCTGLLPIYVTGKDADGRMRLRRLKDSFAQAAKAKDGDVITLSSDVACEEKIIYAEGGTKASPVTLDLNGRKLSFADLEDHGFDDCPVREQGIQIKSVWQIAHGSVRGYEEEDDFWPLSAVVVRCTESGSVTLSECEIYGAVCADQSASMVITDGKSQDYMVDCVYSYENSTVRISDTRLMHWIESYGSSKVEITESEMDSSDLWYNMCSYDNSMVEISGVGSIEIVSDGDSSVRIADAAVNVMSYGNSIVNIKKSVADNLESYGYSNINAEDTIKVHQGIFSDSNQIMSLSGLLSDEASPITITAEMSGVIEISGSDAVHVSRLQANQGTIQVSGSSMEIQKIMAKASGTVELAEGTSVKARGASSGDDGDDDSAGSGFYLRDGRLNLRDQASLTVEETGGATPGWIQNDGGSISIINGSIFNGGLSNADSGSIQISEGSAVIGDIDNEGDSGIVRISGGSTVEGNIRNGRAQSVSALSDEPDLQSDSGLAECTIENSSFTGAIENNYYGQLTLMGANVEVHEGMSTAEETDAPAENLPGNIKNSGLFTVSGRSVLKGGIENSGIVEISASELEGQITNVDWTSSLKIVESIFTGAIDSSNGSVSLIDTVGHLTGPVISRGTLLIEGGSYTWEVDEADDMNNRIMVAMMLTNPVDAPDLTIKGAALDSNGKEIIPVGIFIEKTSNSGNDSRVRITDSTLTGGSVPAFAIFHQGSQNLQVTVDDGTEICNESDHWETVALDLLSDASGKVELDFKNTKITNKGSGPALGFANTPGNISNMDINLAEAVLRTKGDYPVAYQNGFDENGWPIWENAVPQTQDEESPEEVSSSEPLSDEEKSENSTKEEAEEEKKPMLPEDEMPEGEDALLPTEEVLLPEEDKESETEEKEDQPVISEDAGEEPKEPDTGLQETEQNEDNVEE